MTAFPLLRLQFSLLSALRALTPLRTLSTLRALPPVRTLAAPLGTLSTLILAALMLAAFAHHDFLLDSILYFKEFQELLRFKDRSEFIHIFEPYGLGFLLALDPAFHDLDGILAGQLLLTGLGILAMPLHVGVHFLTIPFVYGDKLCLLLIRELELINIFPDLCIKETVVDRFFIIILSVGGNGHHGYAEGKYYTFHVLCVFDFLLI